MDFQRDLVDLFLTLIPEEEDKEQIKENYSIVEISKAAQNIVERVLFPLLVTTWIELENRIEPGQEAEENQDKTKTKN